jgi:cell growth-regulating nucleolar protein
VIRSIGENNANLSQGVKNVLQTISSYDNIPRKKAKFLNFMKNSFKYFKYNELEEAWDLLEVALKENKAEQQPQNGKQNGAQQNGESNGHVNGNKRKIEDDVQPEENGTKAKKKKPVEEEPTAENGDIQEEATEKFNWTEVIRSILISKNNEIKLSKLKKKVLNKYKKFSGSEVSDKLESKFNKKLKKSKGFVVDNEKVKLIE